MSDSFRAEVRDWLAAHVPAEPLPSLDTAGGFERHRAWERELAAARLSVITWPAAYGGRDATLAEWLVFEEEYYAASAPARVGQNGLSLLAPTLFGHGTADQRDRYLPRIATAEDVWAQAWSEPDAGSDLAAIRSRAVRCDGGWLLSGTKTWCSRAAFADRAFGLFRTDPGAESTGRHRGLTYLLFGLRAPGVTVRPIRQLGGRTGFAEIFLDDVFVPDADVVGAPGDGWRIAMSTASHERGLSLRSPGRYLAAAARLAGLWRRAGSDPGLRDRVSGAWIGARAYQLHTQATAGRLAAGGSLGVEASMGKVFWSELDVALHETALDLLGPHAEVRDGPDGRWLEDYLFALAGPIYAGTNEIQRTVIAERVLGLPRGARGARGVRRGGEPPRDQEGSGGDRPPRADTEFGAALHDMLSDADATGASGAARRWAEGDLAPGLALWKRLAGMGVTALAVPEACGGLGVSPLDLVVACEELGHHALPGPVAESLAAVPVLLAAVEHTSGRGSCGEWLAGLAAGDLIATLAMPPWLPYAADAEAAGLVLLAEDGAVYRARPGTRHRSVDPARSLSEARGEEVLAREVAGLRALGSGALGSGALGSGALGSGALGSGAPGSGAPGSGAPGSGTLGSGVLNFGALACSAQLLGAGRALLEASVRHASTRVQFGQPVGAFQAVKHKLADVAIGLEFARPLLDAAAVALGDDAAAAGRDVSAAKVACADAAYRAARAALQVHGAIGYTAEHDLSLWLAKVRALVPAWGSQAGHRARVMRGITEGLA